MLLLQFAAQTETRRKKPYTKWNAHETNAMEISLELEIVFCAVCNRAKLIKNHIQSTDEHYIINIVCEWRNDKENLRFSTTQNLFTWAHYFYNYMFAFISILAGALTIPGYAVVRCRLPDWNYFFSFHNPSIEYDIDWIMIAPICDRLMRYKDTERGLHLMSPPFSALILKHLLTLHALSLRKCSHSIWSHSKSNN